MGAPIAAFLTLVLSLLLWRRLVFRPVVAGMDANLLDGAAIAALNRDRKQAALRSPEIASFNFF